MGRKTKFGEPTKVFTLRIPISKYEETKRDIESLINRRLHPLTTAQKLDEIRKNNKLDKDMKQFIATMIESKEYEKKALERLLEEGTKKQLLYRWRKWKKMKVHEASYIRFTYDKINKNKTLKYKNLKELGIKLNASMSFKEVCERFSIEELIEQGKIMIKFLENMQVVDKENIIYENLWKLEEYYDSSLMDKKYLLTLINEKNLDQCPFCLSIKEKKQSEKLDFERLGHIVNSHERFLIKSKQNISDYMIIFDLVRRELNNLRKIMDNIENCNKYIEMFRNALDKRF